ncbi:MAG: Kazal-type serine protease inhibitor, partial [Patescibacteria group bacterium]
DALTAIGQAARNNGTTASAFIESCGSGIVCNIGKLPDGINGVFTASTADKPGWVYQANGQSWKAEFGEDIKNAMSNFGTGTAKDPDTNKDGVVTAGELDKALNNGKSGRSKVENPDAPIFFRDQETADKYNKFTECILLRPGQVAESYTGSGSGGDIEVAFKPPSISGFGNRTLFPQEFPLLGQVQDIEKSNESQINFDIRRLGGDKIEEHVKTTLAKKPEATGVVKRLVVLPTKGQAEEFVQSLGGNSEAQGTYTVGGKKVDVGKHYIARRPSPEDKIVFDDECNPTEWAPLEPEPTPEPGGNNNNPGGNNGGGGAAPAPDAGGGLLSALMQALLGKQGQQANQQGQNQYGAGFGNGQLTCEKQDPNPVCGADGRTYNNPCYLLQSGTVQVSAGVCAGGIPAVPSSTNIFDQLSRSGAPVSLLNSLKNSIASIFSNIISGEPVSETVVR